jgi:hypothetical protein
MSSDIPKWAESLARDVHNLLRAPDALGRFRLMIRQWTARHRSLSKAEGEWEAKRARHFKDVAKKPPDDPLRAGKPPKRGWKYELGGFVKGKGAPIASQSTKEGRETARSGRTAAKMGYVWGWAPPQPSVEVRQKTQRRKRPKTEREWEAKRASHFAELAQKPADDPLRAGKAPKRGWKYETGAFVVHPPVSEEELQGTAPAAIWAVHITGWVPPELSEDVRPITTYFVPLTQRLVNLDEKYTLLAAIHHPALPKAVAKIEPLDSSEGRKVTSISEAGPYVMLCMNLFEHVAGYEQTLRIFLD